MKIMLLTASLFFLLAMSCFGQSTSISENPYYKEAFNNNPNFYVADFPLEGNLSLTLDQMVFKTASTSYVQIPILLKNKMTDKLSLLGGLKIDFIRTLDWEPEIPVFGSVGAQYDLFSDSFIQGTYNLKINDAHFNNGFLSGLKSQINFAAGFKF